MIWQGPEFTADVQIGLMGIQGQDVAGYPRSTTALDISFDNLDIMAENIVPEPGDANNDGYIDDKDASILGSHWLTSGRHWSMGDFNQDGYVNDKDAAILAAHWTGSPAEDASVPGPTSLALLLGGLLSLLAVRRRSIP